MRLGTLLLFLVFLLPQAPAEIEPAALDGYGPWRFGMTREQVESVLRTGDPYARGLTDSDFPRVQELADGVYSYEQLRSASDEKFTTVSMFVVTDEGVLVADGQGTPNETQLLVDTIAGNHRPADHPRGGVLGPRRSHGRQHGLPQHRRVLRPPDLKGNARDHGGSGSPRTGASGDRSPPRWSTESECCNSAVGKSGSSFSAARTPVEIYTCTCRKKRSSS